MRQNYSTGDTPDTGLTDSFANYHGFVYCPWSKACAGNDEILTYTNVRRPAARRILDLLDEIFE